MRSKSHWAQKVPVQMASCLKQGQIVPSLDKTKAWRHFFGLTIKTNNIAFEVKIILGLVSTYPDGRPVGEAGG